MQPERFAPEPERHRELALNLRSMRGQRILVGRRPEVVGDGEYPVECIASDAVEPMRALGALDVGTHGGEVAEGDEGGLLCNVRVP